MQYPTIPPIFAQLLELSQHSDDDLAWEASLALRFYFERECINGDAKWLADVEAFLEFQDVLKEATGVSSIKDIKIGEAQIYALAFEVFNRIERGEQNAWHLALILKQAACVPELHNAARKYLHKNWRKDEGVSLNLLYAIWGSENTAEHKETLKDISAAATNDQLRQHAEQTLRVLSEIEAG